eukprot:Tbor_TRINITY_DN5189_c2_g3::TRINITY_DN5189_c2_g3_i1::g.25907::m.25907/K07889/RAB5C; Ras-related protein Rab-5C
MTSPPQQPPKKYKLVLLGESGVGKSSLVLRLVKDEWSESQHSTVGASFFRHSCTMPDNQIINFDIWDTAGQERYKSLASIYCIYIPDLYIIFIFFGNFVFSGDRSRNLLTVTSWILPLCYM